MIRIPGENVRTDYEQAVRWFNMSVEERLAEGDRSCGSDAPRSRRRSAKIRAAGGVLDRRLGEV